MQQEPRQFANFDDTPGNDGWTGNSILDEPRYPKRQYPLDEEDIYEPEEDSILSETVFNRNDGAMECTNVND